MDRTQSVGSEQIGMPLQHDLRSGAVFATPGALVAPGAEVWLSTNVGLPTTDTGQVVFDSVKEDKLGLAQLAGTTMRVPVAGAGRWRSHGILCATSGAIQTVGNYFEIWLYVNGIQSAYAGGVYPAGINGRILCPFDKTLRLAANDLVSIHIHYSLTSTTQLTGAASLSPTWWDFSYVGG